ncbi:MAG: alpha/beta hydrolase [Geodermatophilaceae bacterium]|nr:alpha/beta hydrolase [Geodermatophilaceae bacterium]
MTVSLLGGLAVAESSGAASTITEPPSDASEDTIEGLFDVDNGRRLYLECEGTGSPTIVYLHGTGGPSSNAEPVLSLLRDDYRACVYDRANVGRSDPAEGPLTAADAVEDLHTLLATAEVPGPYVFLGGSRGGVVAFVYAGTHPDDIAGVVLLDPDVPGIGAWEQEFIPEEMLVPPPWQDDVEQMDVEGSLVDLDAAAGNVPAVPAILFALEHYDFPPEFLEGAAEGLYQLQQDAVGYFDPGEVRVVDTPHYMEPEIPEEIAAAVREVIGAPPSTETSEPSVATTST